MSIDQMPINEMCADKMFAVKMPVKEMSAGRSDTLCNDIQNNIFLMQQSAQ